MPPWTEYRTPDTFILEGDEDDAVVIVPVRSAPDEEEAFEHVLTELTDWSYRERLRAGIKADYRYAGITTETIHSHPVPDVPCPGGGCPSTEPCHRFEFSGGVHEP